MPYKPYWLQRLPEIIAAVSGLPQDAIDRRTFESIFQLRRRRAIELMHSLGSRRDRRGYVLDRRPLLERLESLNVVAQYRWEEQVRTERVVEQLNGTNARPQTESRDAECTSRVVVEFGSRSELIDKLLMLLRAACNGHGEPPGSKPAKHQLQYDLFERAIRVFRERHFRAAEALFARACVGPNRRVGATAEMYLRICRNRTEPSFEPDSFDEHYTCGVILLNDGRLVDARNHLELARQINPGADYAHYALAACDALAGDLHSACANLRHAIDLQPRNRLAARSDPDFEQARNDPSIQNLLDSGR